MIDINRLTQDTHYRYKMPRVNIKYEGKNTGIKTILSNLNEISISLKRNPEHIFKFLSYELNVQTKIDKNKYIINGKHEQDLIQNLIFCFIDKFVLCKHCENPETFFLNVTTFEMECLACGNRSTVPDHKIKQILIKDIKPHTSMYSGFLNNDVYEGNSEEVFVKLKNSGLKNEEIFTNLVNHFDDKYEMLEYTIKQTSLKIILNEFEVYIENNKKYELIEKFINYLLSLDIKKNDIQKYYTKPQNNKKRSLDFKKSINKYFSG